MATDWVMGSRIFRAFVVGACAWAASTQVPAAIVCDPMLAERPAVYEAVLPIHSGGRVVRSVKLPGQSNVMVLAREGDLDITVEAHKAAAVIARADSAIHRNSVQRLALTTAASADYTLVFTARQSSGAGDSIDVRVVTLPRVASEDSCLAAQQKLAAADQAYALAHDVKSASARSGAADAGSLNRLAARSYQEAASLLAKNARSVLLANAQHAEAAMYNYDLRDWAQTDAHANAAAETYAAAGELANRARALAIGAEARMEIASASSPQGAAGSSTRADAFAAVRASLTELAAFHSRRSERYDEGRALNNVAISYHLQGSYQDALRAYQRALAVFEQANEQSGEAMVLQNSALVSYELGHFSEAATQYARVLELAREEDDPQAYAFFLSNSAMANEATGHFDIALQQFNQGLRLAMALQDSYIQGVILHNVASVYDQLGDRERALELYRQALPLRAAQVNPQGRTSTLRAIGNILREQGKAAEGLAVHAEALSLAVKPQMRTRIEMQMARDLGALGRPAEAQERLQSVLNSAGLGDEVTRGRALAERSAYLVSQGNPKQARADLQTAQRIFQKYEASEDELEAWVSLAQLSRSRGAREEALGELDRALALAEQVRLQTSNPELRATVLQPLRPAFDLKIEILAERYSAAGTSAAERATLARRALATAEQARARALEDFQQFDVSAPGVPADVVARRRDVYRELAARRSRLAAIVDRSGTEDPRAVLIRTEITTLRQQLDEIDARIGAASGAQRARSDEERWTLPLASVPAQLAFVEYWLGAENAYAWTVTRSGLQMTRLGSSADVNRLAREYHDALRGFGVIPEAQRLRLAERLYQLVLAPVASRITQERTLVFAPDGALHYVPFATLRVAGSGKTTFLVEQHDIAVTPSIGMYLAPAARNRQPPSRDMLLVADPVYEASDSRLASATRAESAAKPQQVPAMFLVRGSEGSGALPRLPATAEEAATIAAMLPKDRVDRLEGLAAARDRFLAAGLERYRFIHVASHAVNDVEIPQASALVLSTFDPRAQPTDGRVLAADLVNVQLNAEAVVLSACDTALGRNVAGEGLMGLQYVVLARGAESVVSSLWPVIDQASAQLMSQFYASRLRAHAALPAALGDAMRAMLTGRYKDPGVWGAFTITTAHTGSP